MIRSYICARCGKKTSSPLPGKCPGTHLPHQWIMAGKRYMCMYCGKKTMGPVRGHCPARRGLEDPYHIYMVIE